MTKYVYPAVFTPEEDGAYSVYFPDLDGCYTCGDDLNDAIGMAQDVLAFTLYEIEKRNETAPSVSELSRISIESGEFINYIACDTMEYRKMHNNRAVKKTLTIPEWLNEVAVGMGVNFSQVLQDALLEKIK